MLQLTGAAKKEKPPEVSLMASLSAPNWHCLKQTNLRFFPLSFQSRLLDSGGPDSGYTSQKEFIQSSRGPSLCGRNVSLRDTFDLVATLV